MKYNKNPFKVLHISPDLAKDLSFNDKIITQTYRHMSFKYHSDLGGNDTQQANLNLAYNTLMSNPETFERIKANYIKRNSKKDTNVILYQKRINSLEKNLAALENYFYHLYEYHNSLEGTILEYFPVKPSSSDKILKTPKSTIQINNDYSISKLSLANNILIPNTFYLGTINRHDFARRANKMDVAQSLEKLIKTHKKNDIAKNNLTQISHQQLLYEYNMEFGFRIIKDFFDLLTPEVQSNSFLIGFKKSKGYEYPLFSYIGNVIDVVDNE